MASSVLRTIAITGRVLVKTCHTTKSLKKEDKIMAYDDVWFNIEWTEEDIKRQQEDSRQQILEQEWEDYMRDMMAEAG